MCRQLDLDSPQGVEEAGSPRFNFFTLSSAFAAEAAQLRSLPGPSSLAGKPTSAKEEKWESDASWEIWLMGFPPLVPGETQDRQTRC